MICNGVKECPQGDDERQCVTIAKDVESAEGFSYFSEGKSKRIGEAKSFQYTFSREPNGEEVWQMGKIVRG